MIGTIIWATAFFLTGFVVFIASPFFAHVAPMSLRRRLGSFYFDLAATTFERVLCYIRPNNECKLIRSKWDSEHDTEKTSVGDATRHYEDPANKERRLCNYPFSFVLSEFNKVITPVDSLVGRELYRQREEGREWITYVAGEDDEGEPIIRRARSAHIELPADPVAVDLQNSRHAFQESHEADDVATTIENVKKSQQGFKTTSTLNMIMILVAMAAGAGLAWFIVSNTGDSESIVSLPATIVLGWWL